MVAEQGVFAIAVPAVRAGKQDRRRWGQKGGLGLEEGVAQQFEVDGRFPILGSFRADGADDAFAFESRLAEKFFDLERPLGRLAIEKIEPHGPILTGNFKFRKTFLLRNATLCPGAFGFLQVEPPQGEVEEVGSAGGGP